MKIPLFLSLSLSLTPLFSQDTIYFLEGPPVMADVLEVTPEEIVYQRYGQPNGPTYFTYPSRIKVIRYPGGAEDNFELLRRERARRRSPGLSRSGNNSFYYDGQSISREEFRAYLRSCEDTRTQYVVGGVEIIAGYPILGGSLLTLIGGVARDEETGETAWPLTDGGKIICAGGIAMGIALVVDGFFRKERAVRRFNRSCYPGQPEVSQGKSLRLAPASEGLGIAVWF